MPHRIDRLSGMAVCFCSGYLRQSRVVVTAEPQVGSNDKQARRNSDVKRLTNANLGDDRIHLIAILSRWLQRLPRPPKVVG